MYSVRRISFLESPTTVTATVEVDGCSPVSGGIDSSHDMEDTGSNKGITDPSNAIDVAWASRGDLFKYYDKIEFPVTKIKTCQSHWPFSLRHELSLPS
jgi:hypothetical protein